jgi:hypothetical protein
VSNVCVLPVALDSYDFDACKLFFQRKDAVEVLEKKNPEAVRTLEENGKDPAEILKTLAGEFPNLVSFPYQASQRKGVLKAQLEEIAVQLLKEIALPDNKPVS